MSILTCQELFKIQWKCKFNNCAHSKWHDLHDWSCSDVIVLRVITACYGVLVRATKSASNIVKDTNLTMSSSWVIAILLRVLDLVGVTKKGQIIKYFLDAVIFEFQIEPCIPVFRSKVCNLKWCILTRTDIAVLD